MNILNHFENGNEIDLEKEKNNFLQNCEKFILRFEKLKNIFSGTESISHK